MMQIYTCVHQLIETFCPLVLLQFQDFRFLCPNDTVFDQQHLVCTNWFEVDCQQSVRLFLEDFGHKKEPNMREEYEDEDVDYHDYDYYSFKDDRRGEKETRRQQQQQQQEQGFGKNRFLGDSLPAFSSGNRDAGREQEQNRGGFQGQHQQDSNKGIFGEGRRGGGGRRPSGSRGFNSNSNSQHLPPPSSTTAIPVGISAPETTTRRTKPRVKSDILAAKHNVGSNKRRKNNFHGNRVFFDKQGRQQVSKFQQPQVRPDGKKPRVKSNLRGRHRGSVGAGGGKGGLRPHKTQRTKLGKKVTGVPRQNVKFISKNQQQDNNDGFSNEPNDNNALGGPEVRPDGRPPRVKSDILAKKKNKKNRFFNKRPVVTNTPSPFHLIPKDEAPTTPTPFSQTDPPSPTIDSFFSQTKGAPFDLFFSPIESPHSPAIQSPFFSSETEKPSGSRFSPRPNPTLIPPFSSTVRGPTQPPSTRRPPVTLLPPFSSTQRPIHPASIHQPTTAEVFFPDNILATTQTPPFLQGDGTNDGGHFGTERPTFNSFPQQRRPPGSGPRVKSNIRARQRNRGRGRFGGHNSNRGNNIFGDSPTTTLAPFSNNEFPEFIDEIEERPRTNLVLQQPVPPRKMPRVKSNSLAAKGGKNSNRGQNRVQSTNSNTIQGFVASDNVCSNPFKCPPKKVADGRRPRVKSNIKARNRNFHNPFGSKRGRISGRVQDNPTTFKTRNRNKSRNNKSNRGRLKVKKTAQTRKELDELLAQLKSRRQGKAVDRRVRPEQSPINSGAHSSNVANEFRSETTAKPDFDGNAFFPAPTTATITPRLQVTTTFVPPTLEYDDDDYYNEGGDDYYYADDFKVPIATTTKAPFIFSTTTTTPSSTTRNRTRPSSFSSSTDSSTHRPIIASTHRPFISSTLLPVVPTRHPSHGPTTLLPISESPAISTTQKPKRLDQSHRPRGFPSKEELLAIAKGEVTIPGFPKHRTVSISSTSTGQRTRFPPRQRPTPAAASTTVEKSFQIDVTEAPFPVTSTIRTARQPVTLPKGVASSTVLDPKLPPIPTLPPNSPPVEHVSFLEKTAGRDGTKPRPNNRNKKNKSKNKGGKRQPRVKSDLQLAQINRWRRKEQKKHARQNKSFNHSQVNFVSTGRSGLIRLVDKKEEEEEEAFNEINGEPEPTTRMPRIFASTVHPVTPTWLPSPAPKSRRPGSRRRLPFGTPQQHRRLAAETTVSPEFRATIRTTRSPKVDLSSVENSFATGLATQRTTQHPSTTTIAAAAAITQESEVDKDDKHQSTKIDSAFKDKNISLKPDGRQPRVKSDIRARLSHQGKNKKNQRRHKQSLRSGLPRQDDNRKSRVGAGKAINLDKEDDKLRPVVEEEEEGNILNAKDDQPKVKPDGQKPRVKSDLALLHGGAGGGGNRGGRRGQKKNKNKFRHSKRVQPEHKVKFVKKEEFHPTPAPIKRLQNTRGGGGGSPFFTINTRAVSTTQASIAIKEEKSDEDKKKMTRKKEEDEYDYYYYEFPDYSDEKRIASTSAVV